MMPSSAWRKRAIVCAKLIVTALACALILRNILWAEVVEGIGQIDAFQTVIVFGVVLLSIPISAYKWKIILEIHGIHFNFLTLQRYYFIAMFLNNFLPTSIGGDAYRVYKTMNNPTSKSCAVLAVALERVSGLAALAVLTYVGGIVGWGVI